MSDPLTGLVKKIEQRVNAAAGKTDRPVGAYVIFVSNPDGLEKQLRGMAEKETLKRVSLCIGDPPRNYEVAGEADVTVVIYTVGRRSQQAVTANFALRKGELDEAKADAIVKALSEVLPPLVQAVGWIKPDFDDRPWKAGPGGFGTSGTPGAVVRTEWKTGDIWLRRAITLPDGPFTHLHLQVHHDDDAEIYLNGVLAAKLSGYTTDYQEVPLSEEARQALRPGGNVLAVHCKQTGGGQYIDVGLVALKR
jgi:hypothetical protein